MTGEATGRSIFLWPEIFQHSGHATHVIRMPMGNCHGIKMRDASFPQVWGHNIFSEVELRPRTDRTTSIDEKRFSTRSNHKNRVALSHVDSGHFHHART